MKYIICSLLVITMVSGYLPETQAQTILQSAEEAVALARQHNTDLQAARQTAQWQAGAVEVVKAGKLPTLKATSALEYNYALPVQLVPAEFLGGKPGEYQKLQFGVPYNLTAGAEATYGLYNPTLNHDVRLAELNQKIAETQASAQQEQLETQVIRVYYLTALSREAMEITRKNLQSTDSLLALARERYAAGTIEELDLNRTQSTRLTLADQLEQNQLAYANNLRQLRLLVGQEVEIAPNAAERWNESGQPVAPTVVEEYPQMKLKAAQLNYFQEAISREQATRLPQVSLYGRYTVQAQRRTFNFLDFNQPWFNFGLVGVRLDVPIFNGGVRLRNIDRAKVRADIARTELAAERQRQLAQDDEWAASYTQARKSVDLSRQNLTLAERNMELAQLKYRAGVYTYDQYVTIFNESLQAQNRYLRALADSLIYGGLLQSRKEF
ncbi:MAG: TolC family protein [Bacteroidetes bacterium]|nr:TolC family protein [Bacteroidota bacterium]